MAAVRNMLDSCIRLAYEHDALSLDRKSRIKGKDATRFWSLISELRVGLWLKNQDLALQFDPPAKNGHVGDFEASSGGEAVFIEVKTLFGDREMLGQEELLSKLADYFERKSIPVQSINLLEYPSDFNNSAVDALTEEIERFLIPRITQLCKETEVEYGSPGSLLIKFTLVPGASRVVSKMYGGYLAIDKQLKSKLGMQVDGKNFEVQVSAKDIPSVIILNDRGHWTEPILDGILYGTKVTRVYKNGEETYYRENNGLSGTGNSNLISAVGVFKETLDEQYSLNVKMYLCPKADFPLSKTLLNDRGIKWLQLAPDGYSIIEV
jgi:hypothetical protein